MEFQLLIVDDEAPIRKGLSHFIDWPSIGCAVADTACDGLDAIEKLKQRKIDIIITDIRMPEADGLDLARYVYENRPDTKVIILTGYADFKYAQQAIKYNVVDFLLKPTSKDQLIRTVQNAQSRIITSKKSTAAAEEEACFLKDQLLQELTGGSRAIPDLENRLARCGLKPDSYCLAAFQLFPPTEDLNSLKEILTEQKHNSYCYRYNNLILSIYQTEEPQYPASSSVLDSCREIIQIVSSLCSLDISVGVSACHQGFDSFSKAASEAIQALSAAFYSEERIALCRPEASSRAPAASVEDTLTLCNLEMYLLDYDFDNACSSVTSLFHGLKSRLAKSEEVKNLCTQIYYICSRILVKKDLPPLPADLLVQISNSPAVFRLEDIVRGLIQAVEDGLKGAPRPLSRITDLSIQYIQQNLDKALSLETVANEVHVNPSHLSRTFKKECGESMTEFINKTRVRKACELLSMPDTLAYEAAEKVGFHDPAYFSAIFKRYTGTTPTEYRSRSQHPKRP